MGDEEFWQGRSKKGGWNRKWDDELCVKIGIKVHTNDFVLPNYLTNVLTELKKKSIMDCTLN